MLQNPTHWTKNQICQLHGGIRGEVRGKPKSLEYLILELQMFAHSFSVIHQTIVEIFRSGGSTIRLTKNYYPQNHDASGGKNIIISLKTQQV